MGFGDFIKGQFIDVIEFVDENSNKMLVYKYKRYGNEIKQGANLIVRNGQCAVFVYRGQIADLFSPGNYKLNTENLPILSSLKAITSLFNSPIKSDLYFVNTTQFIGNKWGTKNPIIMRDKELGMVRITAFGTYSFRVANAELFMNEIFGARNLNMTYDIMEFLKSFVSESIATVIGRNNASVLDLASGYTKIANEANDFINQKSRKFGVEISEMIVENVSLPEEVEKLIDEQSGISMAANNMDDFMQYQTARAMRDASKQKGGLAGLGAGYAFANHIAKNTDSRLERDNKSDIEKVREYKKMLDDGIITEEEFAKLKEKTLGL